MDKQFLLFNGEKSLSLWDDGDHWNYLSGYPKTTQDEQYAKVAAAYRAYNLKANTIGNMPFVLYSGKQEFDSSASWENKVKFLPNPSELFRLDMLSLIATNTFYNLRTKDVLGAKTKGLYHAVSYSFLPQTKLITGELDFIQRTVGATTEIYQPDDPRLVYGWRKDHTTEVLPSPNTEAQAIMSAAGQIYYADLWIQHFYKRGGIPPTLVAMKGLIFKNKESDEEKSWTDWLRGLGKFTNRVARIFNADAMDVKQMGSSVADLKNNEVYVQALKNISMGLGMPISRLLSDAANFATADNDYKAWFNDDIIPWCNWLAYEYNRQVFEPLGLRLEFKPETLDPEQEDETERAQAFGSYMDALAKCPTYDVFVGWAETLGLELSDNLKSATEKYYADKKIQDAELAKQTAQAMTQPNKPLADEVAQPAPKVIPAKWTPSLDEIKELKVWRDVATRRLKQGKELDFVYQSHYGGLPADIQDEIITRLPHAQSVDEVKDLFNMDRYITQTPAQVYEIGEIKLLADALNKLASAEKTVTVDPPAPVIVNVNPLERKGESLSEIFINSAFIRKDERPKTQAEIYADAMSSIPAPVINIANQVLPAPVNNEIIVQPAVNNITVQPAQVNIPQPIREIQKVNRHKKGDEKGLIDTTETKIEY